MTFAVIIDFHKYIPEWNQKLYFGHLLLITGTRKRIIIATELLFYTTISSVTITTT